MQVCRSVTETVYFGLGSAELSPQEVAKVEVLLGRLDQGCPVKSIKLACHTDQSGRVTSNLKLAQARAEAVRDAMIMRGLSPSMIQIEAAGAEQPAVPQTTGAQEPLNRRVVITITFE